MKICIIGPSGSGKTYLAGLLSGKYRILSTNLDEILFKILPGKKRIEISREDYLNTLNQVFQKDNWIIEGLRVTKDVFEKADVIIWLRIPIYISLFQQWKRYFTDRKQRKNYGFINNIKLSEYIFRQYYQKTTPETDPKKTRICSLERELKIYKDKLILVRNNYEKNILAANDDFLRGLSLLPLPDYTE